MACLRARAARAGRRSCAESQRVMSGSTYSLVVYRTREQRAANTPIGEVALFGSEADALVIARSYLREFAAVDLLRHDRVVARLTQGEEATS